MAAVYVDLITPPSSPVRPAGPIQQRVIINLDDSDEESALHARVPLAPANQGPSANPSAKSLGKRKADEPAPPPSDDECMQVEVPAHPTVAAATERKSAKDRRGVEDDEVVFEGRTGDIALSDFPHARENCLERPWKPGSEQQHCPNCFCYVCDDVASACPQWSSHCQATHKLQHWRAQRASWKRLRNEQPNSSMRVLGSSGGNASSSTSAARPSCCVAGCVNPAAELHHNLCPNHLGGRGGGSGDCGGDPSEPRWSCEQLLGAVEQVYPEEQGEPAGFAPGIRLRPYQRQSLAFMMNLEASTDPKISQGRQSTADRGKGLCEGRHVRGGFLVDEMGMGKTCVCTALALATRHKGKTVVLVNNTLVGQWCDEIKKFAPGLKLCKLYGTVNPRMLRGAEIYVTTPHTKPPEELIGKTVHRLILDESHLYEKGSDPKLPATRTFMNASHSYQPDVIWCVTGTPFSKSLGQLETQARILGHWNYGLELRRLAEHFRCAPGERCKENSIGFNGLALANQAIAEKLRLIMIRHTKSQRIRGEAALALPASEVETVWLTMSSDEKMLYESCACADGVPKWADVNRVNDATLDDLNKGLSKRRAALAGNYSIAQMMNPALLPAFGRLALKADSSSEERAARWGRLTKFQALKQDLEALASGSPSVSVVIFTHHNAVLGDVAGMLRAMDWTVFEVSRASAPTARHSALRQFQQGAAAAGCAAFVTTYATAAVGLTLTAASRVYLLEASLDPAQEAQAAGRIHRLGQNKEVLVKRLYFKDTLDEAVHTLHEKIRRGALALQAGRFPRAALEVFVTHGVADPHTRDPGAPFVEAQRRYRSTNVDNLLREHVEFDYGKSVQTQVCQRCGKACEVPGTSVWWGKGCWAALNGERSDFPAMIANMAPRED